MVTVITFEYQTSKPVKRVLPINHAHNLGKNGGFYKVQILNSFDQIELEYKEGL